MSISLFLSRISFACSRFCLLRLNPWIAILVLAIACFLSFQLFEPFHCIPAVDETRLLARRCCEPQPLRELPPPDPEPTLELPAVERTRDRPSRPACRRCGAGAATGQGGAPVGGRARALQRQPAGPAPRRGDAHRGGGRADQWSDANPFLMG